MKLQEFLEQNEGKWFAQRTNYYVEQDHFENGKTEITVELLSPNSSEITALCQNNQVDQSRILRGMKSSWASSSETQTNVILVFSAQKNEQEGQFYQSGSAGLVTGRYFLAQDDALTLSAKEKNTAFEERLWFASPNLRLRTSFLQTETGINTTAFYSEIRKLPPKAT